MKMKKFAALAAATVMSVSAIAGNISIRSICYY